MISVTEKWWIGANSLQIPSIILVTLPCYDLTTLSSHLQTPLDFLQKLLTTHKSKKLKIKAYCDHQLYDREMLTFIEIEPL
jgi:hypothetical protein